MACNHNVTNYVINLCKGPTSFFMTTSKTNKNPFEYVRWLNEENNLAARATCTYVHFTVSITSQNSYVEKKKQTEFGFFTTMQTSCY